MQNKQTLIGNIDFKFEAGKKYHIWNGYSKHLDNLWWLNCEFIQYIIDPTNGIIELEFKQPKKRKSIIIDAGLMHSYTKANTGRCYQFIQSGNK